MSEETLNLGGSIELTGFSEIDRGSMIIVKKIAGTYAKKFAETLKGFESLSLRLKSVHETKGSQKYEIKGKVIADKNPYTSEHTDYNLFFALDKVLKRIEASSR